MAASLQPTDETLQFPLKDWRTQLALSSETIREAPLLIMLARTGEFEGLIDYISFPDSNLRDRLGGALQDLENTVLASEYQDGLESRIVLQTDGETIFLEDKGDAFARASFMRALRDEISVALQTQAASIRIVLASSALLGMQEMGSSFVDHLVGILEEIEVVSATTHPMLTFHIHPDTDPKLRYAFSSWLTMAAAVIPDIPTFKAPEQTVKSATSARNSESEEQFKTDTPGFHSDRAVQSRANDDLGRAAVADAIAKSVREVWPDHMHHKRPFAVHLAGRWGSGKSSVLSFLRENLEAGKNPGTGEDQEKWLVVDFNAWLRQDEGTPWWAIMNAVVAGAQEKLPVYSARAVTRPFRRWLWLQGKGLRWLVPLAFVSLVCLFFLFERVTNTTAPGPSQTYTETKTYTKDEGAQDFAPIDGQAPLVEDAQLTTKIVTTQTEEKAATSVWKGLWDDAKTLIAVLVAFFGTIGSVFGIVSSVRQRQAETAKALTELNTDPNAPLQKRFQKVVRDAKRPVAIFIDDLDRCDAAYVVDLLETFQTVYAKVPVLYVVAADRDWIVSAYGQVYKDFSADISRPGLPIGHLFVEKIFQLSVPLPNLGDEDRNKLLRVLLDLPAEKVTGDTDATAYLDRVKASGGDIVENNQILAEAKATLTPAASKQVARAAYATLTSKRGQKAVKHALSPYVKLMDPNPRSLKRLINDYTFRQGHLYLSQEEVEPKSLIHWSILSLRFPYAAREIAADKKLRTGAEQKKWDAANKDMAHTPFFADPLVAKLSEGIDPKDLERLRTLS